LPSLRQTRRELRYGLTDYVQWKTSGDAVFPTVTTTHDGSPAETIASDFPSYVESIYKRNGIVAACMTLRESIFAEVVFRFAGVSNGRTGNLFGTPTSTSWTSRSGRRRRPVIWRPG
jgi:hypothetical protein